MGLYDQYSVGASNRNGFNGFFGNGLTNYGSGYNSDGVNLLTNLTTQQNTIYSNMFAPLESAVNGPDVTQMRNDASKSATAAFDGTPATMARARSAQDTNAATGQIASESRRTSLARSIADVDAQNNAISTARTDKKAAQTSAFDMYASDLGQAQKAFGQVASNESGRYATYLGQQAQQDAQATQTETTIAAALIAAYSDRRLKQNIKRHGTLASGLATYEYEYVWGGGTHVGVMADEVEVMFPHAVVTMSNGYKAVIYSEIR